MNIDDWRDGDPARPGYPYHDYGGGWADQARPGVDHRLMWASGTGELLAFAGDQVNVLGLLESSDHVDELLGAPAGHRYPSLSLNRLEAALEAQQLGRSRPEALIAQPLDLSLIHISEPTRPY